MPIKINPSCVCKFIVHSTHLPNKATANLTICQRFPAYSSTKSSHTIIPEWGVKSVNHIIHAILLFDSAASLWYIFTCWMCDILSTGSVYHSGHTHYAQLRPKVTDNYYSFSGTRKPTKRWMRVDCGWAGVSRWWCELSRRA